MSLAHALPVLSRVDAADLAAPADLPTVRSLNLYGTSLDSTAVRGLARLENLQWLSIGGTRLREAHAVIDRHQVKNPYLVHFRLVGDEERSPTLRHL